jgi:GNAT superfamily N-acetyltransferase
VTDAQGLDVRVFRPEDGPALGDLLLSLAGDPEARHFHPHPFTRSEAQRLTADDGRQDVYFGAFAGQDLVGYGMLRGWDEGYEIPSFGVAVHPAARGAGVGRALLRFAIRTARDRGAGTMMLKVHEENPNARRLYESEGFEFATEADRDGQVRGTLAL